MAKVSGSYESVIRGVSQQVPQDRRSGQHTDQVNMISDPVRGLSRRHGSLKISEALVPGGPWLSDILASSIRHRTFTATIDGTDYDFIYRTQREPYTDHVDGSVGSYNPGQSAMFAFNKATDQFLPVVKPTDKTFLDGVLAGGIKAITAVGRYIYFAGTAAPTYTQTDNFSPVWNKQRVVAWVRGGAYSRTFKVVLTLNDGSKITGSYKTVTASYPELLDTSDIVATDTEYQKKVNDRVYAYNSQVTKWIGLAAEDITPESIAGFVAQSLTNAGALGVTVQGGTICIDDDRIASATGEDGGDGALMRVVGNEVTAPELVSTIHYSGKVVKVKPQRSREDDAFYMLAVPKDPDAMGFTEVSWKECAGVQTRPDYVFCMGTIKDGSLYIADSAAKLSTLTGLEVPDYAVNEVGDGLTSPVPSFFGKAITFLGSFQDRLIIGSDATIFASRPGDYLNFFRASVLTVLDTDPIEMYALGAETDTIRHGATFDRDLLLFGDRYQFAISGRTPLTPKTASVVVASAYKEATDAAPKEGGNFVFYAKYAKDPADPSRVKTSLHQVGQGTIAEAPESFEVSQALDNYITGRPVEIITATSPNVVLLRTENERHGFYVYTYLDTPDGGQRLFDAWSRWEWNEDVGYLCGLTLDANGINAYVLRGTALNTYIACERFTFETRLSHLPYADSLQPLADAESGGVFGDTSNYIVALSSESNKFLMGAPYEDKDAFVAAFPTETANAWVGVPADAYVTPTNPFIRDQQGKAVMYGRFTLGKVLVSVADTAGLVVNLSTPNGVNTALDFNGRILGRAAPLLAGQPVVTATLPFFCGKEVRAMEYTLNSKTWLPLTVTNIEWTGQVFTHTRRVT
jgi:hypothetical protein